jgi:hypothetical protein
MMQSVVVGFLYCTYSNAQKVRGVILFSVLVYTLG